jgi:hypothetical protein
MALYILPVLQQVFPRAGWIHDAELDDVILGAILRDVHGKLPDPILQVSVFPHETPEIESKKAVMWQSLHQTPCPTAWVNAETHSVRTECLEISKKFIRELDEKTRDLPYIPLIVTAPTHGLFDVFAKETDRDFLVILYSGRYNSTGMQHIERLHKNGRLHVVDTNAPTVTHNRSKLTKDLHHMFKDTDFWGKFAHHAPHQYIAVTDFARTFNHNILHPQRLLRGEVMHNDEFLELCNLYQNDIEAYRKRVFDIRNYVVHPHLIHLLSCPLEHEGPVCDILIGYLAYLVARKDVTNRLVFLLSSENTPEVSTLVWKFREDMIQKSESEIRELVQNALL